MPKDYQVSQYDQPINVDGYLELPSGTRIGIERAHIEEDTGKYTHLGGVGSHPRQPTTRSIDYNRAGVPLVEIVSRPDIRSAEHARSYVSELRAILLATGASDAKMEEGSMRVDANVSVRPRGHRDARHSLRDQEPQLDPIARPCHRVRGEAPDRPARSGGAHPAGDAALERGRGPHAHPAARRKRPRTTATSPSPISCRSRPTTHGSQRVAPLAASASRRSARRPRRRPPASLPTTGAVAVAVDRDLDGLAAAAIAAGGDPARVLTHVEHNLAVDGAAAARAVRARAAHAHGGRRRAHRHAGEDSARRDGRDGRRRPRSDRRRRWASRRWRRARSTRSSTTLIAAHPDEWQRYREGDDKARGKLTGFFVGEVMRATQGQGRRQARDRPSSATLAG